MGIYKENYYKKDKNGKWQLFETKIAKAPHDVTRWEVSAKKDLEKFGDETRIISNQTKSGMNKKVVFVETIFSPTEKVERTLITTASKLSEKDKAKYKGIKGADNPIKR